MKIPFKIGDLIRPLYLKTFSSSLARNNPLDIDYKNKTFKIVKISGPHMKNSLYQYYSMSAVCLENNIIYGFAYAIDNKYKIIKRDINYKIKIK